MATGDDPVRRFNVVDGMIVVAAVAASLALARVAIAASSEFQRACHSLRLGFTNPAISDDGRSLNPYGKYCYSKWAEALELESRAGLAVESIVVVWLFAFAAVRLRRPRPPFAVISLQPGMVAFWAVTAVFTVTLAPAVIDGRQADGYLVLAAECLAVPLGWGALKAMGRWRPEAGWIDRFGRALGVCWCAVTWSRVASLIRLAPEFWDLIHRMPFQGYGEGRPVDWVGTHLFFF